MKVIVETVLNAATVRFLIDEKEDGNEQEFYSIPLDLIADPVTNYQQLVKVEVRSVKGEIQ